jgi:hypothetical protein
VQSPEQLTDSRACFDVDHGSPGRSRCRGRSLPAIAEEQDVIGVTIEHPHALARRNEMPIAADLHRNMILASCPFLHRRSRHPVADAFGSVRRRLRLGRDHGLRVQAVENDERLIDEELLLRLSRKRDCAAARAWSRARRLKTAAPAPRWRTAPA